LISHRRRHGSVPNMASRSHSQWGSDAPCTADRVPLVPRTRCWSTGLATCPSRPGTPRTATGRMASKQRGFRAVSSGTGLAMGQRLRQDGPRSAVWTVPIPWSPCACHPSTVWAGRREFGTLAAGRLRCFGRPPHTIPRAREGRGIADCSNPGSECPRPRGPLRSVGAKTGGISRPSLDRCQLRIAIHRVETEA
jgi:hypothetical protein